MDEPRRRPDGVWPRDRAVWGGLTLFAAWCWAFGRWRIVLAPILTIAALSLASLSAS